MSLKEQWPRIAALLSLTVTSILYCATTATTNFSRTALILAKGWDAFFKNRFNYDDGIVGGNLFQLFNFYDKEVSYKHFPC